MRVEDDRAWVRIECEKGTYVRSLCRDIARAVGSPRACRAVGMANHANPVMIVVPCHRVICADGSLGGYGGGQESKKCLLALETHQNC